MIREVRGIFLRSTLFELSFFLEHVGKRVGKLRAGRNFSSALKTESLTRYLS